MQSNLSRRDFLKLAALSGLSLAVPQLNGFQQKPASQNILIVVFDALSATNMSLYGYPRQTTPHLDRLAERAIVYHNHYSAGNFTTPGTASLLTGTHPWTHRAVKHNGRVVEKIVDQNLFGLFPQHHRFAYTHNVLANTLLRQFMPALDTYLSREKLFITGKQLLASSLVKDEDISSLSLIRAVKQRETGFSYSLFFPSLYEKYNQSKIAAYAKNFPFGLPNINVNDYYLLEHAIDYWGQQLGEIRQPYLGYLHFLPPHDPYNTRRDFVDTFANDGYQPQKKPNHIFSRSKTQAELNQYRTAYDEFILYADTEFARFFKMLEVNGTLDNTWLILTSDHGELFERGVLGHKTPLMHQPILKIPLMVFEPGRLTRKDIFTNTSSVDVLPTLLNLTGQNSPAWVEGQVLPPFNPRISRDRRPIFALDAKDPKGGPINKGTAVAVKDDLKLMHYFGYPELGTAGEFSEFYNLADDPFELEDLNFSGTQTGLELLTIVKEKIATSGRLS
jgi:arylsulfatase A-like enzyme